MSESVSKSVNDRRNNGWKWATFIIGGLFIISCVCVSSAAWGGLIGFTLGRTRVRTVTPMPGPFAPPMPRIEPWQPDMPMPEWPESPEPPEEFMGTAWLGVTFITREDGAEVTMVVPESPADQAGIREGDLIVSVDDDAVTERQPLDELIRRYSPGDRVDLSLERNGRERTIEVRLGARMQRRDWDG